MTTEFKIYAQFNSATFAGRILASEVVTTKKGDEFLSVTVITAPVDDSEGITITFNNSNGLLALAKKGGLPVGRQVTICGHIASVHETYVNKDGEVVMLKRPRIHLVDAAIPTGGLGATPTKKDVAAGTVVVKRPARPTWDGPVGPTQDETPELDTVGGF